MYPRAELGFEFEGENRTGGIYTIFLEDNQRSTDLAFQERKGTQENERSDK
jgi:hypothetical protein